jgi:hypothetical protein
VGERMVGYKGEKRESQGERGPWEEFCLNERREKVFII